MIIEDTKTYSEYGLIRRYSNRNVHIQNELGDIYSEAVDLPETKHAYVETDIPVDSEMSVIIQDPDAERIAALERELEKLKGGKA